MSSRRDLYINLERMRRDVDDLFGEVIERGVRRRPAGFTPRVDVYYAGDPPRAVVKAELAGVAVDEVALEIRGRQLLLSGHRRTRDSEGRLYQQVEIEHGPFRRVVELGADVLAEKARATYEDGMLLVEIPLRDPAEAVRQVPISSSRRRTPSSG